jgi:hypothetical protein
MSEITEDMFALLIVGRAPTITQNGATLTRQDDRFVMKDADGAIHTLLIDATNRERLNAHWQGFAQSKG